MAAASEKLNKVSRRAGPWIETFARIGMACKGAVYGLVGLFAVSSVLGLGERTRDLKGTMRVLDDHWWGRPLLLVLGLGLLAYGAWRGLQAVLDPENEKDQPRVFKRIGYSISLIVHFSLGYFALKKAFGFKDTDGDSEQSTKQWTQDIMSLPFGEWLIGLGGAGLALFGLFHAYYGIAGFFEKKLKTGEMSKSEERLAKISGQYGHLARGLVFVIVGGFLVKAAFDYNAREARGLKGAMDFLQAQPIGSWMLIAVGVGLVAYAVFMFLQARYRRIKPA